MTVMAIDFEHLKRYTGDDAELIAEVLDIFSNQTSIWMRALDPASDDETWSDVSHALKGSAQTVGAKALGELCDRAEAMVGDCEGEGSWTARREWIADEIAARVEDVETDIQRWKYAQQMAGLKA